MAQRGMIVWLSMGRGLVSEDDLSSRIKLDWFDSGEQSDRVGVYEREVGRVESSVASLRFSRPLWVRALTASQRNLCCTVDKVGAYIDVITAKG